MDELAKQKRQLIDSLESSRQLPNASWQPEKIPLKFVPLIAPSAAAEAAKTGARVIPLRELNAEITRLSAENQTLRATNALLAENALRLENQALACWRDAENAERQLALIAADQADAPRETDKLLADLQARETENQLLVQALIDSENTVTRLVAELTAIFVRRTD